MKPRTLHLEPLESRCLLSATVIEHGNVGYFLNPTTPRVERYDIVQEAWLSPIDLIGATEAPTVGHVDGDGIYVAHDKVVYRYNPDGTGRTHLLNAQFAVQAIHTDGRLLILNCTSGYDARLISIDKTTNTIIDATEQYLDAVNGSSIAPSLNRIFGRTMGLSPSDITHVDYGDNGTFLGGGDSPYHGDFPGASTTWIFPGDMKVVDDSGTIYSTLGLTRLNSFGTRIADLDFLVIDVPIVLYENTLTAYTSAILPSGSVTLDHTPTEIFVNSTNVITFTPDSQPLDPRRYLAE